MQVGWEGNRQVQETSTNFTPRAGTPWALEANVRLLLAPNPSPMTHFGTNTYLVGTRDIAVIDPGPDDPAHLHAILSALEPTQRITHIIVTHTHVDHCPLAKPLSEQTGAPVLAYGTARAGRSSVMSRLVRAGLTSGGEGIDAEFLPDQTFSDGDVIIGSDWRLEVLHTPGHLGNHVSLALGDACFTADHVMGWASSLVSPPDGDLTDFMASCAKLQKRLWRVFYPGHGAPITDPGARLNWLVTHRKGRERAILDALSEGPASATELAQAIYTETPPALLPAATRNVLAHLIDLYGRSEVAPVGELSDTAQFHRPAPGTQKN